MSNIEILQVTPLPAFLMNDLQALYHVHDHSHMTDPSAFGRIRAIIGSREAKVDLKLLATFPQVELISILGNDYQSVDVPGAIKKGVKVAYTPDVANEDVADLTMGLIIGLIRKLPQADRFVRNSDWVDGEFSVTKRVTGLRLGLIGFGALGQAVAKRAQGFNMRVSYFDKAPVTGFEESWVAQPRILAEQVDVLVLCVPPEQGDVSANAASEVIVDQSLLDALGSKGYVVNVTQPQLIDQSSLIKALQSKKIAGAALDVFASEPKIAAEFKSLQNVVLSPHIGSATEEARRFMAQLAVANLQSHFTQGTLLTPVPQMALLAPPSPL